MSFGTAGISVACEDTSCAVLVRCWTFDNEATFKKYMGGRVKSRLIDAEGTAELVSYYDSVSLTGFSDTKLKDVFSHDADVPPWRVGEALAECLLEDTSDIRFPWNSCRDQKVENASPPGADLMGFEGNTSRVRFLFGEVKTSGDKNHPPHVMYGRSGMTQQLETLKTERDSRKKLVNWIGWRAKGASWEPDYRAALAAYISSDECVGLQGVLVRDTQPTVDDLKSRSTALNNGKPQNMDISLCGVYCPSDVSEFPALVGGASTS